MQEFQRSSPALYASPALDIGRRNGVNFYPSLVCLPQDPSITSRPDAVSVGLGAMKQPLAVVTRTSRRLLFFKCKSRTAPDAVIPSHIDPFSGSFEVAGAAMCKPATCAAPRQRMTYPSLRRSPLRRSCALSPL